LDLSYWEQRNNQDSVRRNFRFFPRHPDITNSGEFAMQEVVDKVMQTYGMMKTLSAEEPQADLSGA
jgi:hypothetical protein